LLERASFSLLDRRRQQPAKSVTKNRGLLQYATSCSQGGDITFAAAAAAAAAGASAIAGPGVASMTSRFCAINCTYLQPPLCDAVIHRTVFGVTTPSNTWAAS